MTKKNVLTTIVLCIILVDTFSQTDPYWQQHVDYKINVKLNDVVHELDGSIEMDYTNNSLQELTYIWMHNNGEKAEAVIDCAILQNPYSSDFLIRKAECLLNRKKYKEALDLLDKAEVFDSTEVDIFLIRSDIYVETNEIDKAADTLNTALKVVDGEEKDILYAELSDIYEMKEDFTAAYNCLLKALKFNPKNEDALHKIAHIIDMTDRYEDSIALHASIIEKEPYLFLAWYNMGRGYMGLSLYEKAIECFEYVIAINEDFDIVYRDVADIYYRIDDFAKAIEMFEAAQEKSGGLRRLQLSYRAVLRTNAKI